MQKVVVIGPAHPLRGGLSTFNERLARQFQMDGADTTIYTFSLQYPDFLFPGTTQYSTEPAPQGLNIKVCINSINPLNWIKVGRELKNLKPDLIIVRYWLPLMGPCLGSILRIVRRNKYTKIVCIADNVIPHEKRPGDTPFTRYFLKPVHAFVTMSEQVLKDLRSFTSKPARTVQHPLYDNFGEQVAIEEARRTLELPVNEKIILFFGFIRKYKGLDLLLDAMKWIKDHAPADMKDIKLLVAGEFYDDAAAYDQQINELGIRDMLILRTDFITDSAVKYYLSAADFVIQPYRNATQSGVTPLAYHFEKPMLVTNVGGLPSLVPHGKAGLVTEPTPESIANGILELYRLGAPHFKEGLLEEKQKLSWPVLTAALRQMAAEGAA
jgi:glycosyltransferase involved in cell wall biosynthesis